MEQRKRNELIKFKEKVDQMGSDTFEKGMFDHFDLNACHESKTRNVPMYKVIREKAPDVSEIPAYPE